MVSTIVHLDVDAYYVAVERELRPELKTRTVVVSQYNPYGCLDDTLPLSSARILYDGKEKTNKSNDINGSLIAVSYEAREMKIRRNDRGLEAIAKCPDDLVIVEVPKKFGKANLTIYRDASERVMSALAEFMKDAAVEVYRQMQTKSNSSICSNGVNVNNKEPPNNDTDTLPTKTKKALGDIIVEKASIDEIYIDLSLPIQTIIDECRAKGYWGTLYAMLTSPNSTAMNTTIGGLETSKSAIATNSLSKDDIRKGSSLQVLDSNDAANNVDDGDDNQDGREWWARDFPQAWSKEEIYLAVGSLVALKARESIVEKFDGIYTLSAGVSTNKVMSKLASALKKPNRQTLINPCDEATLQNLFHPLPIGRIRGLGGKLGDHVEEVLQVKTVGELAKVPLTVLKAKFDEKQGMFLFRMAQGLCDEPVTERTKSKRVGAGKTFRGKLSIRSSDHDKLKKWIQNLSTEVVERTGLDKTRYAKTLTCWLHMEYAGGGKENRTGASHSGPIPRNASEKKCTDVAFELAKRIIDNTISKSSNTRYEALLVIGMEISASNFVLVEQGMNSIRDAFQRQSPKQASTSLQRPKPTASQNSNQKVAPKSIVAFLKSTTTTGMTKEATTEPSAKKELLSKSKGVHGDTREALAIFNVDARAAPTLQHTIGGNDDDDIEGSHAAAVEESSPSARADDDAAAGEGDPDLEYAKQLQASFDRESEVISSIEQQRRSSISSENKPRSNKRKGGSSISSFFKKAKKRT